jgi:phosphoribosylanthranilate isomerase/indole-3-glycerol phosphate synthase/phosphoribosylanthranilate isomerase
VAEKRIQPVRNKEGVRIQVKICGLTRVDQAVRCARLGADLIGLVFYPPSPRWVDRKPACEISAAVGSNAATVGVFVNESYATVMDTVRYCGLRGVQLHGNEPPELIQQLRDAGLMVLKALFHGKSPLLDQAGDYDASAFLLECGQGLLPGGNARVWDWAAAGKVNRNRPVVLAGGLDADNISRAIRLGKPDAVDVSSGVERAPGIKDMEKVAKFITAVDRIKIDYHPKKMI